jgi:arylsulfatase
MLTEVSRRGALLGGAAATAALTAPMPALAASGPQSKPNILFITLDEMRFDALGCAGNLHIRTPNIDALAARGTMFSHTFTQGPLCQPARASIITGQYVKQTGMSRNGLDMNPDWPTMMKALQAQGYQTAMVGKTHFSSDGKVYMGLDPQHLDMRTLTPWGRKFGLDYLLEEFDHFVHRNPQVSTPYTDYLKSKGQLELYRAEAPGYGAMDNGRPMWAGKVSRLADDDQLSAFVANSAIEWLDGGRQADKPFFLWVSFIEPHPPLTDAEVWWDLYKDADIPTGTRALPDMPDNAWGRYLRGWATSTLSINMTDQDALLMARRYYALVSQVDHRVGAIMRTLRDKGLDRDTWIVFTSDHGEMLAHHNLVYKNVFYLGSVQVPNIIVPPGGAAPRRIDAPVQSVDITATILDIGGASLPTGEGLSLLPMLDGRPPRREVVFSELAAPGNGGDVHKPLTNYMVMIATHKYRYTYDKHSQIYCELFDLENDPGEMHNLVTDPMYAPIMADLHKDYVQPFIST